jgi:hypothetical protein
MHTYQYMLTFATKLILGFSKVNEIEYYSYDAFAIRESYMYDMNI